MKPKILRTTRKTNFKWLNLFARDFTGRSGKELEWMFASRKENPDEKTLDVVAIIATMEVRKNMGYVSIPEKKLILVKQYRVPVGDYVYELPAGLTEGKTIKETVEAELREETGLEVEEYLGESGWVYASPGSTDESCVMVFVKAKGELSNKGQEAEEDIEPLALSVKEVEAILKDKANIIGAKAWGVMLSFVYKNGNI